MKKKSTTWTVDKLAKVYQSVNFPEYQREPNVWSKDAKKRLVDSMLREFDIASIYIYTDRNGEIDCVDGRQRLGAIMSFLGLNDSDKDNGFEFNVLNEVCEDDSHPFLTLENKNYLEIKNLAGSDDVAARFVDQFRKYELNVVELSESKVEEEFNLQFTRLNLGKIVNSGEKLHAMVGELRDLCFEELGRHPFLIATRIPTRRYSREQLAAQIIAQVISVEETSGRRNTEFARTRHLDLQKMFKRHTTVTSVQYEWIDKVKRIFGLLDEAFSDKYSLQNRAIIVSTVMLAYIENINTDVDARDLSEFIDEFVWCLKWQIGKSFDIDREYRYLIEFQRHVTQASVEKPAVSQRAAILKAGLELWKSDSVLHGDIEYVKENAMIDPKKERHWYRELASKNT